MVPPPPNRRAQIASVTLDLLADLPLEEVTTRRVAAAIGLTQPALFRHFASREALLLAAVELARTDLVAAVGPALALEDPRVRLEAFGRAVLAHVAVRPGLPRLLFAAALPGVGPVRDALVHLLEGRQAAVAGLVEAGQRAGALDPTVAPEEAGALYVAMLQGLTLRWELNGRAGHPAQAFDPAFALWWRAVAAHGTALRPSPGFAPDIDAAVLLAAGQDPLPHVLEAVARLAPGEILTIDAPFRPAPLLARLAALGLEVGDHPVSSGWRVTVQRQERP